MWHIKSFDELTKRELYEIYYLRTKTFVVEQTRIYQEVDANDLKAIHVFKIQDGRISAYARVYIEDDTVAFGRVVTAQECRGQGLGNELIEHIFMAIEQHFAGREIQIEAQQQVEPFYDKFEFTSVGTPFIFESTPHIKMVHQAL